jgi:hypothetical protein
MNHNASSTARFFAAVPDTETAGRIYRLAGALKRAHKFGGKIIDADRPHMSLFFLGGLPNAARGQNKPTLLELFTSVTILDVFLGMLTGLLATFAMKSGSSILSKTSLGTVDVANPYGVAFVAAIAGLFMDKFYSWLEPLLVPREVNPALYGCASFV